MPKRIRLLIIDPQSSFCRKVTDPNGLMPDPLYQQLVHDGELCVPNAWEDMNDRLPTMINRLGRALDGISVSLDSHRQHHIAHCVWYVNRANQRPNPFTLMREDSGRIINYTIDDQGVVHDLGEYTTFVPAALPWTLKYLKELVARKRYLHCLWPEHCLIGSDGYRIVPNLFNALHDWEKLVSQTVDYVAKGSHPCVEHFSAVQAEVPFDGDASLGLKSDSSTQINADAIGLVMEADEILLTGEAGSHCVPNTVFDMADFFGPGANDFTQKCVIFTDAMSPVPGYEKLQQQFIDKMVARKARVTTTVDYLSA